MESSVDPTPQISDENPLTTPDYKHFIMKKYDFVDSDRENKINKIYELSGPFSAKGGKRT